VQVPRTSQREFYSLVLFINRNSMKVIKDGDQYLVAKDGFINLQDSSDYFFISKDEYEDFINNKELDIVIQTPSEKLLGESEWRSFVIVYINGEEYTSLHDGEPEDNTLDRNFNGVFKIIELLKKLGADVRMEEVDESD
jgi:hypothetical protein